MPRACLLALGLALLVSMCGSAQPATRSTSTVQRSDLARTVDIGGGRKMYIACTGSGSPTVVLIAGLQIAGDLWDSPLGKSPTVFPSVAKTTRVCLYDRPGTTRAQPGGGHSRSDPVPQPTTPQDAVADLHALLDAAGEAGPYVLVGHSYGGLVARLYAHVDPAHVAGMVLVDSFSPELQDNMTAEQWTVWKAVNATKPADVAAYPALERIDFDVALQQVRDDRCIHPMPLVVLTADQPIADPPGAAAGFGAVIERAQHAAQRQVAQLVPGALWITDTHSGHNIMLEQPQLVTDSIVRVVRAVRDGRTRVRP